VDVGGTFIDFAFLDEETRELMFEKQLATPTTLAEEFLAGMARLSGKPVEIGRLAHGTTLAVNSVIQEQGARVGLLTTLGFRDVLALGRGGRPEIYNWLYMTPEPLVPRYLRREVPERVTQDGTVLTPLDTRALDREVDFLVAEGVEAVAISFLHSYANPDHEHRAAERLRARYPQLAVTVSSDLVSEWREFERTSTAVHNAYIQPLFREYVSKLRAALGREGYVRPLAIMQSSGGVMAADRAAEEPIRTLESGPAGGVIGAKALTAALGLANVICTDVGGTSFDVALIEDGEIRERTGTSIGGRPILGPLVDIVSIGAGGGSVAWIDRGVVKVGPRSAGANPGPVCFGLGGNEPTVTDCHLVLGRIDPENFLGSRMELDVANAERAIREQIAEPLSLSLEEAAAGIVTIAEANMTHAIRLVTIERGLDPRDFVLLSYGGGGGLFAASLAAELSIPSVIVPPAPANFSAWGILTSPYRGDASLTRVLPLEPGTADEIFAALRLLTEQTRMELGAYGFAWEEIEILYRVDVRYSGQEHTITVPVEEGWFDDRNGFAAGLRERFLTMHRQLYGYGDPAMGMEVVTHRCRAVALVPPPDLSEWPIETPARPAAARPVYFREAGGFLSTPVHDRDSLARGQHVEGPGIVQEWTTTIVVPPAWALDVDRVGNLVLGPSEERISL
jgi:N-methylhydantoinase A